MFEHRSGFVDGFTKQYGLKRLVYFERFDDIRDAIQREHNIKHWPRTWKIRKIVAMNPDWKDLYPYDSAVKDVDGRDKPGHDEIQMLRLHFHYPNAFNSPGSA